MTGQEKVKLLMSWQTNNLYPEVFAGRPRKNTEFFSNYTTGNTMAPINNISHTNIVFLVAMYNAESGLAAKSLSKEPINISFGGTINESICEVDICNDLGEILSYEVAVCNVTTSELTAFSINASTGRITTKIDTVSKLTLLGSFWDILMADQEFYDYWHGFKASMDSGEYDDAWNAASVLNDNIYRRVLGYIPLELNSKVNDKNIELMVANGMFEPTSIVMGEFPYLHTKLENTSSATINLSDFVGKYKIDPERKYTVEEEQMMKDNKLDEYYIVDENDIEICNDIVKTTNTKKPFRNFVFVGAPGSGKSKKAQAIANAIVEPEVLFCCNPSTEIFDIFGQVMPPSVNDLEREAWNFAIQLEELGGINYRNVAKVYQLPTCDDILIAPEDVYFDITGEKRNHLGNTPSVGDAVKAWTTFMAEQFNDAVKKLKVAMKEGSGFTFKETNFVRAIENGWLIEVQEPNVILNEGVLVGLNSILNEGVVTLQTGRTVYRHRDSVVIFTTNHNLYGLRDMNQSFLDRAAETFYIDKPPAAAVADRIMSISGMTDRRLAMEMAKLGEVLSDAMAKEGIEDGVCGMRSLINWAIKSSYVNPYDAAIKTVINKTSLDAKCRSRLMKKLDESYFYQFRGK